MSLFVATKDVFCRDAKSACLLRQKLYLWQLPPTIQHGRNLSLFAGSGAAGEGSVPQLSAVCSSVSGCGTELTVLFLACAGTKEGGRFSVELMCEAAFRLGLCWEETGRL